MCVGDLILMINVFELSLKKAQNTFGQNQDIIIFY
jgi:hypothetical protein